MITIIKSVLKSLGCDIVKFPYREDRFFIQLLSRLEIDTLFDIGANIGQFATTVRKNGYQNKIISFEPLSEAYTKLSNTSKNQKNWDIYNSAIGANDGEIEINVSENLVSSSILPITSTSVEIASETKYYKKEIVSIHRLDTVFNKYVTNKELNVFVKIDTQGYEKAVIEGASQCLPFIKGFIMELSFVTLYEGETLFHDMVLYMKSLGFEIWRIQPGFTDPNTQQMLQADVIFIKKSLLAH